MNITHRKIIPIIGAVILALLLAGCGAAGPPKTTLAITPAATATLVDTPAPAPTATLLPGPTATMAKGSMERVKLESAALANNLIGEPSERSIQIYLPPGYESSGKRYPALYYLPGYGDQTMGAALPGSVDSLIHAGTIQDMIIVVVPGNNRLGGSFYVNSPATGNWEDFVTQEVVGYVDSHYRTLPKAESRGISGHSMGGFGALNLAMQHPEVFSAVYSMSPGLFDENGLANSQMYSPEQRVRTFLAIQKAILEKPQDEQQKLVLIGLDNFTTAYGLAFAPDPQNPPFYFDYPYSDVNGEPVGDAEVWKRWESGYGGIAGKVVQYKDNLLKLKGIVVDYGTNDEYAWIPQGCVYFDKQLTAAGIPHEMAAHDGNHQSRLMERIVEHALPFFSEKLAGE
jgi:S-formylglutathione hydrolase FrmB